MRKLNNAIDIIIGRTKRFFLDTEKGKLTLYGIVLFIALVVAPACAESYQHQYKQQCDIYAINEDGTVDFIDPSGEMFYIDTVQHDVFTKWLDADYKVGDAYMITFFDNFTDHTRRDDGIIKMKRVVE